MSGTVKIARSIFDHELFADQPLTEREAWIWLIMDASWKPRKKRVGDFIVDLGRGQLAGSVRFFAKAWSWTPAKVQRFIKRLENLDMISLKTDTGVSVLTICNYDEYQGEKKSTDTGPIQDRYTSDTNQKKGEIREEGKDTEPNGSVVGGADAAPLDEISEAVADFNQAAQEAGWPKVQSISPARRAALKARLAEGGGIEGWRTALAKARASPMCGGQNDRGWRCNFDFLTRKSSFAKLMEGNYDNRPSNNQPPSERSGYGPNAALEQIARLTGLDQASGYGRA